jgi:predicted nucleotidyltransferase
VTLASMGGPSGVGEALFPKIRRKVLALFLLNPDHRYYFRETARLIGDTPGSIQRELKSLTDVGILVMEPIGIQKFYRANKEHPVFEELRSLAEKTFGLADILKDVLRNHTDKIAFSFVFGSIASGQETGKSDIDLLVVGSIGLRELAAIVEPLERATGRPINPTLFSAAEFKIRVKKGDHFVVTLLDSEKLFVVGTPDDLK